MRYSQHQQHQFIRVSRIVSIIMKIYRLSDDRVIEVKKTQGQLIATIKNKDGDKFMEFTPSRERRRKTTLRKTSLS